MNFQSFEYFKSSNYDPFFEVEEALHDVSHPIHLKVKSDVQSIPVETLTSFYNSHETIKRIIARHEDRNLALRTYYLIDTLKHLIAVERKNKLLHTTEFYPYSCNEDLQNITIDKNGLADILQFQPYQMGLYTYDSIYQLCPSIENWNSSYWLSELIFTQAFQNNKKFKIRLDPLVKVPKHEYNPLFQKMWIYGKRLDWNRIRNLQNIEDGRWLGENNLSSNSIDYTDFVWVPNENEIHFTCEELPKSEELQERGSRYFHAIFDKSNGYITHCDGAIRYYEESELVTRRNYHVKNSEVRKIGTRVKIFQIDEPIEQDLFINLATTFFVWNSDVLEYFN